MQHTASREQTAGQLRQAARSTPATRAILWCVSAFARKHAAGRPENRWLGQGVLVEVENGDFRCLQGHQLLLQC